MNQLSPSYCRVSPPSFWPLAFPSSLRPGNAFLSIWKASLPFKHSLTVHCYWIKGPRTQTEVEGNSLETKTV